MAFFATGDWYCCCSCLALALTEFHLFGVIGSAIAVAALGFWLFRRTGSRTLGGEPVRFRPKTWHSGAVWGGLLFGAGWAITGACPGTALAQIGEGKLVALATIAGILAGTYTYGWVRSTGMATPPLPSAARGR